MSSLKLLSAIYQYGLGCGIFSVKDVITLSDKVIEVTDSPQFEIIELSMMSSSKINDIEGKLYEISGTVDVEYIAKIVLSLINQKLGAGNLDIKSAVSYSTRLLIHTGLYLTDEYYNLYYYEDAYDLAVDGIHHDLENVIKFYKEDLNKYSPFFADFQRIYLDVTKSKYN